MFRWLTGNSRRRTGQQLYERIVAQARRRELYLTCGVPDTMDGRLEMILLHVVLVLERLKRDGAPGQRVGQHLMECLVADVDDALRQIGIGDDGVAGRLPRFGRAIVERARDYGAALANPAVSVARAPGDPASAQPVVSLEDALVEHVYRPADAAAHAAARTSARRMADYARAWRSALDSCPSGSVMAGTLPECLPDG